MTYAISNYFHRFSLMIILRLRLVFLFFSFLHYNRQGDVVNATCSQLLRELWLKRHSICLLLEKSSLTAHRTEPNIGSTQGIDFGIRQVIEWIIFLRKLQKSLRLTTIQSHEKIIHFFASSTYQLDEQSETETQNTSRREYQPRLKLVSLTLKERKKRCNAFYKKRERKSFARESCLCGNPLLFHLITFLCFVVVASENHQIQSFEFCFTV